MPYDPRPFDPSRVDIPAWLEPLLDELARHNHDVWARQRLDQGWIYGPERNDERRTHPDLVPFARLSDEEKAYDRNAALATIQTLLSMGCRVLPAPAPVHEDLDKGGQGSLPELLGRWNERDVERWRGSPESYVSSARAFYDGGDFLQAIEVTTTGLAEIDPASAAAASLRRLSAQALLRAGSTRAAWMVLDALCADGHADAEVLGTLGRMCKDLALRATDPAHRRALLEKAIEHYGTGFRRYASHWHGVNLATLLLLAHRRSDARDVAARTRLLASSEIERLAHRVETGATPARVRELYWALATLAEVCLILGDVDAACRWYGEATELLPDEVGTISTSARQCRLLAEVLGVEWSRLRPHFPVPTVVIAAGHLVDRPGRATARFPSARAAAVQAAVGRELDRLGRVALFASAACGADLLAHEAVIERGGEVHVVLPYERAAFFRDSVAVDADDSWAARFERVVETASAAGRFRVLEMPRGLSRGEYFRHANQVLLGTALLAARRLDAPIRGIAVWDGETGEPGGTSSAVDAWRAAGVGVTVIAPNGAITLDSHVRSVTTGSDSSAPSVSGVLRLEPVGPPSGSRWAEVLAAVRESVARTARTPITMDAAGEALILTFDHVIRAGEFALDLLEPPETSLPGEQCALRILLHAVPQHYVVDASWGRTFCFGASVANEVASLLPPNTVYATADFAALAALAGSLPFEIEAIGQRNRRLYQLAPARSSLDGQGSPAAPGT